MDNNSSEREIISSINLHREESAVSIEERETKLGKKAKTIWFTGLSGSGKSTIAKALERFLFDQDYLIYRLDGDNLRMGLNKNLGFSSKDRSENIRRVAEVAKLMNEAGVNVICSFISPYEKDRKIAKDIIGSNKFLEIYLSTPIEICEERDPHGLYKKARQGEIKEFTGITDPYEVPKSPNLEIDTTSTSIDNNVKLIVNLIENN